MSILTLMAVGYPTYWFIGTALQFGLCFIVLSLLQRILLEQNKRTYCRKSCNARLSWQAYLRHLHSQENGTQLSCVVRCCLNMYFDHNDSRVSNSIDALEHRCNLSCVSLFYRYYIGFCSSKIRGFIALNHVFLYNARLSWEAHSYVADWPVNRTLHHKQNSFSSRTIRMWNSPRAEVVIFWFLRNEKSIKYRNIITGVFK